MLPLHRAFHASARRLAVRTVTVPSMGDSISEGTLVEILKKVGDTVHADEVVLVLETDKVRGPNGDVLQMNSLLSTALD